MTTPYGPLVASIWLNMLVGEPTEVKCISPFALIWYVAEKSSRAAQLFAQELGNKVCKLCFYHDGVTPGNPLRPDVGRSFDAISILETVELC